MLEKSHIYSERFRHQSFNFINHSKLWSKLQIVSIRNLRYLSPCSVLANIFEFVGLAVIAYYIFGSPLPRCHHENNGDDGHNHDDDDEAHMMTITSISTSKVTNPSSAQAAFPGSPLRANSRSSLAPPSLLLRFDLFDPHRSRIKCSQTLIRESVWSFR